MRPIIGLGEGLGLADPKLRVIQPFVHYLRRPRHQVDGEPRALHQDLGGANENARHGGIENNLAGRRVERHLVVGRVAVEVRAVERGLGGLVIANEAFASVRVLNDPIQMARQVDRLFINVEGVEIETFLYRWPAVGFDNRAVGAPEVVLDTSDRTRV